MEDEKIDVRRSLPRSWREKVVKRLAQQGVHLSKGMVTKIFNGYKKNDPNEKKVLEAILKTKEDYQKEKEALKILRESIETPVL